MTSLDGPSSPLAGAAAGASPEGVIVTAPVLAGAASTRRDGLVSKVVAQPLGLLSIVILTLVIAIALAAPWLVPRDPNFGILQLTNAPPGGEYVLGGDSSGRDILSRLIASTRGSMLGVLIGTGVALALGVCFGLVAGYFGGLTDTLGSWASNLLQTVPNIVVLMALYTAVGASMPVAMAVFGVLAAPLFYRLVRGLVIGVKRELFVDAARVAGLGPTRIIGRHVLFAVRAPIVIQTAFVAGTVIAIQSGLEFLGLGDPKLPSWGGMLQDAFANLYQAPVQIIWPGLALTVTIAAFILFGNALRDGLEGRGVSRRARRRALRHAAGATASDHPLTLAVAERAGAPGGAVLSIRDLQIAYPNDAGEARVVVDGVSLNMREGEILGLVGESGSGKTQIAFAALGLLPDAAIVTRGTVIAGGVDMVGRSHRELAEVRGRVMGYIPQEPMSNLDPAFTVGAQLVYAIRAVSDLSNGQARDKALALLERVGIADPPRTFSSYPHEISGGMAQRVLIAGAVVGNPRLLIADEPTTALDVTVQAEVLDLIRDLQRERGMSVLLVSHNFGVIADLCDRVAVMRDGRIVEMGEVQAIFDAPQHPYTQQLLRAIPDETKVRDDGVGVVT